MSELELTVTRSLAASRPRVFAAWLDPAMLARFMLTPTAHGRPAEVSNTPEPGGRFEILMKGEAGDVPHKGTYLEIEPVTRLKFTWGSPFSPDDSVVTIDLAEDGEGRTILTLHQVKFLSEGTRNGHMTGWNTLFDHLQAALG